MREKSGRKREEEGTERVHVPATLLVSEPQVADRADKKLDMDLHKEKTDCFRLERGGESQKIKRERRKVLCEPGKYISLTIKGTTMLKITVVSERGGKRRGRCTTPTHLVEISSQEDPTEDLRPSLLYCFMKIDDCH